ncbi:energy transducer TonB [Photobacterium ganghwense]|uniref:Protein TonB n=1 Tax=Photobacterium ganghwense TaxID=320778 RepID=A0A0J1K0P4_9GAMM|nr:energy transducer TonB [Photobacterium ganghwense]KLV08032.1 energy transducer TonB [Photobacterium ganghwense]PSU07151.1 energy transducer TonB [Photobacterium ganghwense]QSV15899.1 energy transducer TonB [Photobacterium ganghwense]
MFRLLIALPVAFSVALGLFTFMAWMVDNGHPRAQEEKQVLAFDMVMVEQERDVSRRQRAVPEPPETPEPPPQVMPKTSQSVTTNTVTPTMPSLSLDTAISGLAINVPTFSDFGTSVNQQAMPLYKQDPVYPPKAQQRGIEGYVVFSFTVDAQGRPTDIQITDANPKRIFDREAMRALKKWKYQPKVVDGRAVPYVQTAKIVFKMEK